MCMHKVSVTIFPGYPQGAGSHRLRSDVLAPCQIPREQWSEMCMSLIRACVYACLLSQTYSHNQPYRCDMLECEVGRYQEV